MTDLFQVNGKTLLGLNHVEVVTILKELPQHVRIVCARRKAQPHLAYAQNSSLQDSTQADVTDEFFNDELVQNTQVVTNQVANSNYEMGACTLPSYSQLSSVGGATSNITSERLVKAKSEQSLPVSQVALESSLNKMKSRSLEPLSGLAMWTQEPVQIELHKGDRGLGFSILDYQV